MSHLLRCGLVAAGLVTAFAAGFYLNPVPALPTVAAQPAPAPVVAPPIHDPEVKPATALGPPQAAHPEPDPLDAAGLAMIRKEMGIKTTVLDKPEPLPAVLADAQQTPPIGGPMPMGGPMPRLEPPPALAAPMIDHAPMRRPDLPPGTTMRITVRDPAGSVTTVTTAGRVTIELVAADGPRPGPEPGPMPREVGAAVMPEPLRSLLPILLGSPSNFPALAMRPGPAPPVAWDVAGNEVPDFPRTGVVGDWPERLPQEPAPSAREWVERITNTTVVEEVPVRPYRRPDPFAEPVTFNENMPEELERLSGMTSVPGEDKSQYVWCGTPVFGSWGRNTPDGEWKKRWEHTVAFRDRLKLARATDRYLGGRSLVTLVTDPDWKPTTATPESCRWEVEPPSPRSPFDGANDIVIPPGRPAAPTVARTGYDSP